MEAEVEPALHPNLSLQPPAALEEPVHFPAPDQYPHHKLPFALDKPHTAAEPIPELEQHTLHQLPAASEAPHTAEPTPVPDQQTLHQLPAASEEPSTTEPIPELVQHTLHQLPAAHVEPHLLAEPIPTPHQQTGHILTAALVPPHREAEPTPALDLQTLHQLPADRDEVDMNPATPSVPHNAADVTLPGEDLNSLLEEATGPGLHPAAPEQRSKTYPIWIYKTNFRSITTDERDGLNVLMLTRFLDLARKGEMVIEFRITSNYQDLSSGKLKIATENPNAIIAIKRLLQDLDDWGVLGPDDLSTTEGQAFWTFSPPVLQSFIQSNTLCELILAHTGGFLEQHDIRTFLPARRIKDSNNCYLSYIFLTYKAQIYFQHFNWKVALIGSTLTLTPYGAPRGTTHTITKDPSPPDLVTQFNSSHLG